MSAWKLDDNYDDDDDDNDTTTTGAPMVSLEFFIDIILLAALWLWG
jgi:hypothetical protein